MPFRFPTPIDEDEEDDGLTTRPFAMPGPVPPALNMVSSNDPDAVPKTPLYQYQPPNITSLPNAPAPKLTFSRPSDGAGPTDGGLNTAVPPPGVLPAWSAPGPATTKYNQFMQGGAGQVGGSRFGNAVRAGAIEAQQANGGGDAGAQLGQTLGRFGAGLVGGLVNGDAAKQLRFGQEAAGFKQAADAEQAKQQADNAAREKYAQTYGRDPVTGQPTAQYSEFQLKQQEAAAKARDAAGKTASEEQDKDLTRRIQLHNSGSLSDEDETQLAKDLRLSKPMQKAVKDGDIEFKHDFNSGTDIAINKRTGEIQPMPFSSAKPDDSKDRTWGEFNTPEDARSALRSYQGQWEQGQRDLKQAQAELKAANDKYKQVSSGGDGLTGPSDRTVDYWNTQRESAQKKVDKLQDNVSKLETDVHSKFDQIGGGNYVKWRPAEQGGGWYENPKGLPSAPAKGAGGGYALGGNTWKSGKLLFGRPQ